MRVGWTFFMGLMFSLGLNLGILGWGLALLSQQETWHLKNQAAGSDTAISQMMLAVVASQSGSELDKKTARADVLARREVSSDLLVKSEPKVFDKPPQNEMLFPEVTSSQETNPEWKSANTIENNAQKSLGKEVQSREINIKRPHEKQNASGPASNRNVIERNIESGVESSTDEIDLKKESNTNQQASTARSGDKFAVDIEKTVSSNIQGCYPEASKRRGEEGVVIVYITKASEGVEVKVLESSGYARLDRCAISAVQKSLSTINAVDIPVQGIRLKPIRFRLLSE